uniref:Fibronectin type-III domain-containing protein n=1 Tax=Sinocyclocheilus rhinocerous TaxID=307959 RepID=A0A673FMN2_9TELE
WEFISFSVKPKTPFNLTLQYANGTHHFFWKNGDHTNKERIQIEEMKLDPDTMYTVMVKSEVDKTKDYNGTWSDWSSAVKWKTAFRDEPSQVSKIAIGMFAMVGLLILLMSIPAARVKVASTLLVPQLKSYKQTLALISAQKRRELHGMSFHSRANTQASHYQVCVL